MHIFKFETELTACCMLDGFSWMIFILGNVDYDPEFTFDEDTEVYGSCAASLNDEFWVLGGNNKKRQVFGNFQP